MHDAIGVAQQADARLGATAARGLCVKQLRIVLACKWSDVQAAHRPWQIQLIRRRVTIIALIVGGTG